MTAPTSRTPSPRSVAVRSAALLLAALLAALALLAAASPVAALADEAGSPCQPSAEDLARYEADGTLEQRQAFQDALGHDQPDESLIQQAIARQNALDGVATNTVPTNWQGGMPTEGTARVVLLRVSFPAEGDEPAREFFEGDTLEALQAIVDGNGTAGVYPYESLNGYYQRSSYGKLSIEGEAFDYRTKHARSYYTNNIQELYHEALAALDPTVDFSRFDGNDDGLIDAIYLHFAGGDAEWGTTWWSNADKMYSTVSYDGVSPCKFVTLHNPSDNPEAARTIIHETGHVLGLPDYYSYTAMTSPSSGRTGSLTFDMMDNNTGDHNGFSKWLLGWIKDDDVTRVVANSSGITVTRGGQTVQQADPTADGSSSTQIDLGAFIGDDGDTGGIVVVSSADEGPFSSYYLLQYDRYVGNQSVSYTSGLDTLPIPSGFRMYRIQASLTQGGADFIQTNTFGNVNDQLIELVDADMAEPHNSAPFQSPSATSGHFGCMLTEGVEITPDTYPSTNFYESKALGYTGISVRADACGEDGGTLTISHSGEDVPDLPDFAITPVGEQQVLNMTQLRFEATVAPHLAASTPDGSTRLIVDGKTHPAMVEVDGMSITVSCYFDPDEIKAGSSCEIVFPAGQFIIAQTGTEAELSPEIRIALDAGDVAAIARTGSYVDATSVTDPHRMTDIVELADGTRAFFYAKDGRVALGTVSEDGTALRTMMVDADIEMPSGSDSSVRAIPLADGGIAYVLVQSASSARILFVDAGTGAVTAEGALENAWLPIFSASDEGLVALHYNPGVNDCTVISLRPDGQGGLSSLRGTVDVSDNACVGDDAVALIRYDEQGAPTIAIVSTASLAEALEDSGEGGPADASDGSAPAVPLPDSAVIVQSGEYRGIFAADENDDGIALLMNARTIEGVYEQGLWLLTYAPDGTPTGEYELDSRLPRSILSRNGGARVSIADGGAVAVTLREEPTTSGFCANETLLLAADDEGLALESHLLANSPGAGAWLEDGGWLSVGWHIDEYPYVAGSPAAADETTAVDGNADDAEAKDSMAAEATASDDAQTPYESGMLYYVTEPIAGGAAPDPTDPDDPENPVNPEDPDDPDDKESQKSSSESHRNKDAHLASAGDGLPLPAFTVLFSFVGIALLLLSPQRNA